MFVLKYIYPHTKKDYVVTGMAVYGTAGSEITKPYGVRLWSAASRPSCFVSNLLGSSAVWIYRAHKIWPGKLNRLAGSL